MKSYINILFGILSIVFAMSSCTEDLTMPMVDDDGIKAGEPVLFTTYVPGETTRAISVDESYQSAFLPVKEDYTFNIEMFKYGTATAIGTGIYQPTKTTTGEGTEATTTYSSDGTLTASTSLYWPDNVNQYGFKATTTIPETEFEDQSTKEKFIAQDLLEGYGFEPLLNDGTLMDNLGGMNYRTSKEWYAANKTVRGMLSSNEEYKKIPLYLQHKRSRITVRLKAGEGVERNNVAALSNIQTQIYSYPSSGEPIAITPYGSETTIDYTSSDFGTPTEGVATTEYTCVVEPHNYLARPYDDPIASIRLSGMRFTFYASNDFCYPNSITSEADGEDQAVTDKREADIAHMNGYNLEAGKHLIITATLGLESRKIVITAYVVDWDETVYSRVVDDYGQNGNPIQIKTREELYEFLSDPTKNKAGNVAIIQPVEMNLEKDAAQTLPKAWNYNTDDNTSTDLYLNCTLNLAGATLRTEHPIFKGISSTGNLVNGVITVGNATVNAAIATTNEGSIEHIDVLPKNDNGLSSSGKATVAGLVEVNYGTISSCESDLPVEGLSGVVGGIAAISRYGEGTNPTMPVIDGCTVNARVGKAASILTNGVVTGGGIVGKADGRVTNNNFSYGRTLLQDATDFKNSIHSKYTSGETFVLRAYGNRWPTTATSNGTGVPSTDTNNASEQYYAVIDSQVELAEALTNLTHNDDKNKIRLSKDFEVTKVASGDWDGWTYGKKVEGVGNDTGGDIFHFHLYGDNHTIITDAMLFSNIAGTIQDLTIRLSNDLIATTAADEFDVMAPLAYSVYGSNAKISNVQVKSGNYRIQAATVSGLVIWAYDGATIENCQCKAKLQVYRVHEPADGSRMYSGGIVATAADATITRCVFHNTTPTLYRTLNTNGVDADTNEGFYFGGILGGTAVQTISNSVTYTPNVTITDCTSWFSTTNANKDFKGAIVGYAAYPKGSNNTPTNGLSSNCEGNWWRTTSEAIGGGTGDPEVKLLGNRNAVTPTEDENYDKIN